MLVRDQRAKGGGWVHRVADDLRFGARLHGCDESVEDWALNVDALGAQAHLAAVEKGRAHDAVHGSIKVAVRENNAGVLATKFE